MKVSQKKISVYENVMYLIPEIVEAFIMPPLFMDHLLTEIAPISVNATCASSSYESS